MNTQNNNQQTMTIHLSQSDIDAIYRKQQRIYWEADFVNRCIDRYQEEIGLCNIPLETIADNVPLLDMAYEIFNKKEDMNIAYIDTLDAVVDEVERWISKEGLPSFSEPPLARVAVIIDGGIVSRVFSTDSRIQVEITELDDEYASYKECNAAYAAIEADTDLQPSEYELDIPGFVDPTESEVKE